MFNPRLIAYNLAFGLTLLGAVGCDSKPATPPPGAPTDVGAPPTVELGPASAPQDAKGPTTESPEGGGTPKE